MVRKFFKDEKYRDKPSEIMRYITWALRSDGPAFYRFQGLKYLSGAVYKLVSSSAPTGPF
ncbi:hypothetical protein DXG01_015971 [Tephrocybe rancida]|nr:hypothetical protein DXG01_015971 [Tephrocybe rancida]